MTDTTDVCDRCGRPITEEDVKTVGIEVESDGKTTTARHHLYCPPNFDDLKVPPLTFSGAATIKWADVDRVADLFIDKLIARLNERSAS